MLGELIAAAPRPLRVDLAWSWTCPGTGRPACLLRRGVDDPPEQRPGRALTLVDAAGVVPPGWTGGRLVELGYRRAPATSGSADLVASVTLASTPSGWWARVWYADTDGGTPVIVTIDRVAHIEQAPAPAPDWATGDELRLYTDGEEPEATITVRTGPTDGGAGNRWEWRRGGARGAVEFDRAHGRRAVRLAGRPAWWPASPAQGANLPGMGPVGAPLPASTHLEVVEETDPDTGLRRGRAYLADLAAPPDRVTWYTLRDASSSADEVRHAWARASGEYGFTGRLYGLLPEVHRRLDEPDPGARGTGQLRRFLAVLETHLDGLQGGTEALRDRHDPWRADPDALPHLAALVGWRADVSAALITQRHDVAYAAELYASLGTAPAVRNLVRRFTGADVRIREYGRSVFRTNAPQTAHLWELWERTARAGTTDRSGNAPGAVIPAGTWNPPEPVTRTDAFDGRPALVVQRPAAGDPVIWRCWHSDRAGTRRLWCLRNGSPEAAVPVDVGAPEPVHAGGGWIDEEPALAAYGDEVWLVWSSDRVGAADLWISRVDGGAAAAPVPLTFSARAHHPAATFDGAGRLWMFWDSDRSGRRDIWVRCRDGTAWSAPERVTSGDQADAEPGAAVDGDGRLWVVWSRDHGRGSALWASTHDDRSGRWSEPVCLGDGDGRQHDEAPCAVSWQGSMWVFWHSDRRTGHWRVWGRRLAPHGWWGEPFVVSGETGPPLGDKEPAAVVDGAGDLRVCWRSARRAWLGWSRTVDTRDRAVTSRLGSFDDPTHYLHDARAGRGARYHLGTVGIHLVPGPTTSDPTLVESFLEPFRPVQTRYLCLDEPDVVEIVAAGSRIAEAYHDEVTGP